MWPLVLFVTSYLQSLHSLLNWLESLCLPVKEKHRRPDQRATDRVWIYLTGLGTLLKVWVSGDADNKSPLTGTRSRRLAVFTPLKRSLLSDTLNRQWRWPHSILFYWKGARRCWFSWECRMMSIRGSNSQNISVKYQFVTWRIVVSDACNSEYRLKKKTFKERFDSPETQMDTYIFKNICVGYRSDWFALT